MKTFKLLCDEIFDGIYDINDIVNINGNINLNSFFSHQLIDSVAFQIFFFNYFTIYPDHLSVNRYLKYRQTMSSDNAIRTLLNQFQIQCPSHINVPNIGKISRCDLCLHIGKRICWRYNLATPTPPTESSSDLELLKWLMNLIGDPDNWGSPNYTGDDGNYSGCVLTNFLSGNIVSLFPIYVANKESFNRLTLKEKHCLAILLDIESRNKKILVNSSQLESHHLRIENLECYIDMGLLNFISKFYKLFIWSDRPISECYTINDNEVISDTHTFKLPCLKHPLRESIITAIIEVIDMNNPKQLDFYAFLLDYFSRLNGFQYDVAKNPDDAVGEVIIFDNRSNIWSVVSLIISLSNLQSGWNVTFATSSDNMKCIQKWMLPLVPNIRVIVLKELCVRNFDINVYNSMVMSKGIWERTSRSDRILLVQNDGLLIRPGIEFDEEIMNSNYLGAPWVHNPYLEAMGINNEESFGNGGLSIRNRVFLNECIQCEFKKKRVFIGNKIKIPEDIFYSSFVDKGKIHVASRFSFEQIINPNAFGMHKPWLYHDRNVLIKIYKDILSS